MSSLIIRVDVNVVDFSEELDLGWHKGILISDGNAKVEESMLVWCFLWSDHPNDKD